MAKLIRTTVLGEEARDMSISQTVRFGGNRSELRTLQDVFTHAMWRADKFVDNAVFNQDSWHRSPNYRALCSVIFTKENGDPVDNHHTVGILDEMQGRAILVIVLRPGLNFVLSDGYDGIGVRMP